MKNTKAKYLIEDVEFSHDESHLAYTLGSGAASGMNEAYILKADETEISEEEQEFLDEILKATEGDLPNSAFAYVPDKDKTSTRKLRIDDANHVRSAVAALGKGMMGNKVQIPSKDLPAVKSKVRTAYKKFFPENEVPDVLKSLEDKDSDAMSESVNKTADIGTNNKEETQVMSDNLTQADLQKALEEARIEWAKEQEIKDLTKSKTESFGEVAFLKGNDELVIDLAKSVVEGNDIVEQLINKANEHIASIEKAHEEALAKEVAAKEEIKKNFGEEKTSITEELKEETAGQLSNESIQKRVAEIKKAQQKA